MICCCSLIQLCPTLCNPVDCSTPGLPIPQHLLELAQVHVHGVSDAIQPSYPLSPSSSAVSFSQHEGLFQWVSCLHQVAKLLELQLQHHFFQRIFRLISFRMDWLDLLAVQGTLKSLLQNHSSKAPILWCSAFYMVQPSYLYITTGKKHSFSYMDFCRQSDGSVFNMLSGFVIAFIPRSKHLLITWLQSPSTVFLEIRK